MANILNEIVAEKISDDKFKYYEDIPKLENLLNVKVVDHLGSGTRSSVFNLSDGRVLKITDDMRDAAGLKYAMDNHPKLPVVKVYGVYKYKIAEMLSQPIYRYCAIREELDIGFRDEHVDEIQEWFNDNYDRLSGIGPTDLHSGNVGMSDDKSTPLNGLVILDPQFMGIRKVENIPELR